MLFNKILSVDPIVICKGKELEKESAYEGIVRICSGKSLRKDIFINSKANKMIIIGRTISKAKLLKSLLITLSLFRIVALRCKKKRLIEPSILTIF